MVDDRKKDHKSAGKKRESKKTDDGREHKSFRHQGSSKSSNKRKEPELRDDILYSDEATAGSGEDGYTQSVKREEGEQGRKTHHSKRSKQTNKYVDQQEENGGYTGWGYTGSETTTKGKGRQVKEQLKDFNDKFYSQGKGGQY